MEHGTQFEMSQASLDNGVQVTPLCQRIHVEQQPLCKSLQGILVVYPVYEHRRIITERVGKRIIALEVASEGQDNLFHTIFPDGAHHGTHLGMGAPPDYT